MDIKWKLGGYHCDRNEGFSFKLEMEIEFFHNHLIGMRRQKRIERIRLDLRSVKSCGQITGESKVFGENSIRSCEKSIVPSYFLNWNRVKTEEQ